MRFLPQEGVIADLEYYFGVVPLGIFGSAEAFLLRRAYTQADRLLFGQDTVVDCVDSWNLALDNSRYSLPRSGPADTSAGPRADSTSSAFERVSTQSERLGRSRS